MTPFAFILHPIDTRDVARKYPVAKYLPDFAVEAVLRRMSPKLVSEVTGIRSKTGAETHGWFIGCPLTPRQMMTLPLELVYSRIVQCAELAAEKGAKLIGLGAFTSVVGDGGITVAARSSIAVTTGNSYTVATAIQGTLKACAEVGVDPKNATLAVVGATGSIGKTCARILGPQFGRTFVVGRDMEKTEAIAAEGDGWIPSIDLEVLRQADAVVTVTSAGASIVEPRHLRPGAVVCDVSRPRDVSARVAKERPDVLVIEGGVVSVPGDVDFHFNFGFPPKTAYACMSETMLLSLEDRAESFTLGKDVSSSQVEEMIRLAEKHGFELAGFRSFEKAVAREAIDRAKSARAQVTSGPILAKSPAVESAS